MKFPTFGTHDACLENALNKSPMTLFKVACHLVGFLLKKRILHSRSKHSEDKIRLCENVSTTTK